MESLSYVVMQKPFMDINRLYSDLDQWENVMRSIKLWHKCTGEAKTAANELVDSFVKESDKIEALCFKFLYDVGPPKWGEEMQDMMEARNPLLWITIHGANWGGRYDINGFVDFLKDMQDCYDRAIAKFKETD